MSGAHKILQEIAKVIQTHEDIDESGSEFKRKTVYRVECECCQTVLTDRGMKSSLLSDRRAVLYSTDLTPNTIGFVNGDYTAFYCYCRLRDIACLICGNVLGYHINLPCKHCLSQDNNGHFWMFRNNAALAQPVFIEGIKVSKKKSYPLYWGFVTTTDNNGGERYCGDGTYTAERSCKLAVSFSSCISLYVREPRRLYIDAYGKDGKSCLGISVNRLQ